ncbi:MAG: RNA polymerase subunit sigma-70 [Gammaproteobacteria bacterium]|nr:RNA polymerase subunit sigma-70 [Gammaproteobacteria bacterium]MDH3447998.1 RNA polymerase subunit sigma-70 [Gammaproteobacteria bacterium]
MKQELSRNTQSLSRLDIEGGGQVVVSDGFAYVGHMKPPYGTSIIDVSDPRKPRVCARLEVSPWSHSHKVRVCGDIMVTNVEQDRRHFLRRESQRLAEARDTLTNALGRRPEAGELARELDLDAAELDTLEATLARGYDEGGFKVWDISDRAQPRLLSYQRTHGFGVHRFDLDERYAYISTEMPGYLGNILVIYDLINPEKPEEVARWWMPGQHLAGGETPTWQGYGHRLHHALRVGDELWASVWHAGFRVIDISDISSPKTRAAYSYHPWVVEPTHTVLPVTRRLDGRRVAVVADEEHEHRHGQPHAGLWLFDVTDLDAITPLSTFHVSEMDSPWSRAPGRFGMHQFQEHIDDHLVYCAWFSGGLRIVDIADPTRPVETGFYIPAPAADEPSPQTNDVDLDARGLVYLLDRNRGFEVVEFRPQA